MQFSGFVGLFYTGTEWIMRFTVTNFLWGMVNSPLIILALLIVFAPDELTMIAYSIPLFILAPFLFFPSTVALFATVRDWIIEADIGSLGKAFITNLKNNYKQSVKTGAILTCIWFVWVFDVFFFQSVNDLLGMLFVILGILLYVFTIVYFCLNAHYDMKIKSVLKNAFLLTLGKPLLLLLMLIISFSIYYISFKFLFLFIIFSFSILAYMCFYVFYRVILKVESKIAR